MRTLIIILEILCIAIMILTGIGLIYGIIHNEFILGLLLNTLTYYFNAMSFEFARNNMNKERDISEEEDKEILEKKQRVIAVWRPCILKDLENGVKITNESADKNRIVEKINKEIEEENKLIRAGKGSFERLYVFEEIKDFINRLEK